MDLTTWALYAFIAALILAGAILHYRLREPAGRGRHVLGALRGLAVALLVLLLFDPAVPAAGDGAGRTVVVLDRSLSMRLASPGGTARWQEAEAEVRSLGGPEVVAFGEGPAAGAGDRGGPGDPGEPSPPGGVRSLLAPALRAALEAAPGRIVVVTDGAIEDAADASRIASGATTAVEVLTVGGATAANLAVAELEAPAWVEVGEEAAIRAAVSGIGEGLPDSVGVVLERDGERLDSVTVAVPPAGGLAAAALRFTPDEAADGPVRLDVRLAGADAVADDDVRSAYVRIADEPAGAVLVSFRPDQEPRFLLPVLERALGIPVRGWLALPGERYVRLGTGREAGTVARGAAVREAASTAELLVVQGLDDGAPGWARELARRSRRILVLSGDPALAGIPLDPGPARAGDWYLDADPPASPVASLLAGWQPGDLPPLTAVRVATGADGFWAPARARAGRQGAAEPVLLAGTPAGRRVAVALGEGFWRWAFAGDAGRRIYDRFWSGVAGWLAEDAGGGPAVAVRPVDRVVARGAPVLWRVDDDRDSVEIALRPVESADPGSSGASPASAGATLDTVVAVEAGTAAIPPLPPGHYRYAVDGGAEGELTVESYSPEFTRAAATLALDGRGGSRGRRPTAGRPLRATPWPYVALVLLLCAEWVLRRRWGLR